MPDIKGNNQKVYDFLSSKSVKGIGENADQFQQFMQKDENRRKVYDYLSSVKAQGIGDSYDEFSNLVYESKPDYSFSGSSFKSERPSNLVEVAPEPKQETAPAPAAKEPEYQPANFVESAPNVREEVPAKPEEEKRPFTEEELLALRDQYQEDYRFKGEYEQKEKEYKDHMRSLQNIRGNVAGLDETLAKYKAEKQWLDENAARYQEASTNWRNVEGRSYVELLPAAKESLKAKMADNRQYMATPQETITGGRTPFEKDEKNLHEKANDIYSKAEQVLNQGSKFDPGYDSGDVGAFLTAFRQYLQGGINNVDKDTITMGLASGTAMAKARDAMEHNNALVDGALKKMGMADGDVAALMSTIATDTESLNTIVNDLDQRKGELDAMESTLKDMVSGKADRSKIEAYAKEYEKKVDEYNDIIKKDFNPAKEKYDRDNEDYKKVEEAVAAALESGLTGGEKALLDAVQELTRANMLRANDVSTASKSGASFEQTLEFMLDFLLTKGLGKAGTKAATKLTARHLERKMGKEAFEYMAKREVIRPTVFAQAAMDIPVSLARTAVMFPRTIKAYGEHATEYSGKDPMGKFQLDRTKAEAFGNAVLEDFIEYWSEGFGEYFSAGEQALFRAATRNAPKTMIGRTLKAYQGSIGQFLDYGKFSGQLNETLEEVVGSGLNALAGLISDNRYGDKKALNDFFTKDNLATLTLSFLPLSAIGAATNISAYNRMKENYDSGVAGLEPFFKSGAISREELDNLAAGLNDLTPEEAAKKIADIEKRAAEKNNGALPKSFRDNIMGYLQGTFSMSLRNEEWENSKQKVEVATAYADTYNVQDVADAYDLNEDERTAREAAAEAGFTEDELDKDAWQLGMDAANLAAEDQERSQILQNYAVAKGANKGLADGYKANTDKMSKAYGDAVMDNVDVNGNVVTATVNVQGQDVPVFVISPDATVNADGTITTPTGTDGLVTFQQGLGGQTMTVKASQLSNAQAQATGDFIMQKQEEIQKGRAEDFKVAQDTMSARGKAKALSGMVGQQVYFEGGGVFQPLKIERIRDNGQTVVISGDRKALQGIARAMNISIPAATMLEAPSAALYDNLAKEQDGSITTDVPAERQQAAAEEVREEEAAPAEPAMDLNSVIDEDVDVELDGQKQKVHVLSVKDGTVTFSDETGRDRRMPESQFVTAMQGTQMPVEEAPVAEVQAETPAAEVSAKPAVAEAQRTPIPVDEKSGEKIYDAPGVPVQDALEDLYATEGLTEADVDQYIAERAAETEAARNPERGKMSPQAWGQAKKEAARVADFWAEMAKAAQERKSQTAAVEQAPVAETPVAEAPAAEAPVAEQPAAPAEATPAQEAATATEETQAEEPTKESLKPYKKMVSRAKKWQKRTGIKVRLCTSIDEVNDPQARAELEKGEKIAGWFDPETGGVGVYLPNISSEEQLDKTIVHEVVSHKGLKGMLGDEGYNALCDRVWKELMTRGDRAKYMRYVRHLSGTKEFLQRAAADEYIANLSENVDFSDNRNLFEKIVDYIAEWFKEKFGNESPLTEEEIIADAQARATDERRMTRRTLTNLLIDSMKLYEARTREGQDEANERREISANTGGSMETGKGKKNSTKFSIVSTVSGVGMNVIENDGTGRVAFEMPDGRRFDADHPITAEDISSMPDTVMSYMMEDAVEIAHLKPEAVQRIWQAYADQLNAFLRKGVPTNGMTGEQILKDLWEWEVENDRAAGQTRFRIANQSQNGFISNAEAALDRIKMEKATPEQWVKMLEKEGGLKSGEDKWLGLSDWLKSQDRKSITKDEIAEFIEQNRIQIEEVKYSEDVDVYQSELNNIRDTIGRGKELDELQAEVDELVASDEYKSLPDDEAKDDWLVDQMVERYGDDFRTGYFIDEVQQIQYGIEPWEIDEIDRESINGRLPEREINSTRLGYTTKGLDNKREIALTVPTIEPWNEDDKIHFGDAGDGRAVAWVRFGDTNVPEDGGAKRAEFERIMADNDRWYKEHPEFAKYGIGDEAMNRESDERTARQRAALAEANAVPNSKRVLVIDEIQSKRHQEGREHGYRDDKAIESATKKVESAQKEYDDYIDSLKEKYGGYNGMAGNLTEEENKRAEDLNDAVIAAQNEAAKSEGGVPAAPFEKNWHELAMKRMLRLAAEEGYDYVAWTTGDQQADRYSLGGMVSKIDVDPANDGTREVTIVSDGADIYLDVEDETGTIVGQQDNYGEDLRGKKLSDVVGKEMAVRIMGVTESETIEGDGLRIGGEGMRGFYDDILPRFMNKYGKKWGVKVNDIQLPQVEKAGRVMHAVPVTPEMKESVMQGQTMFRKVDGKKEVPATGIEGKPSLKVPVVVSTDAKVIKNLDNAIAKYKNGGEAVGFIPDIARALGLRNTGTSQYGRIIAKNGEEFILRLSNHNATTSNFDKNGEENGISIVISRKPNEGITNDGDAHVEEFFYSDKALNKAPGSPLSDIASSVKQSLYSGEYKDTTGLAAYEEANGIVEKPLTNKQKEARIESAEWDVTERNLDAMGQAFGVKVNRVSREDMPKGHKTEKGYFDASYDELTICMDNVLDERDALATMIHETVGYNGLRELFGDQFQQDMVNIYAALNPEGRTWVNAYIARNGLVPGDAAIVDGMIEYMANLAEKADPNDTVWNRINELLGKSVDIVYGTEGFEFTNRELAYVLRAANEYAKNPEWLNTTEGKAKDTLWKRELGINESNPDRPTDPDGPGAGTRYRRVETGNAVTDYEEEMKQTGTIIQMEFQDADLPIKIGVEKIMREKGRLTKDAKGNLVLEKLPDDEDYVTRHNQASSRADTEAKEYELFFFKPLLEKIKDIQRKLADGKNDAESMHDAYDRILDYLYAMSGLERNEWERANGGEKKDWSGITSLMKRPKEEWREAEADARAMVDRFKKDVGDDAMLDDLWDAIRACSDFTLDHAYKYELLTKKEYEELRGTDTKPRMWDYYLPLRGFKGGTVEDEYNYSSFKNGTNGTEVNKEAKGRWTEAENPIANLYHIALSEIVQGNENWAKQALYNFVLGVGDNSLLEIVNPWYMEDPSSGNWVAVYPNPNESYKDFEARMQEERKKGKAIQPKKHLKLDKPMANPIHKQEHIIKLKIGGQDRSIMVKGNNAIARAVQHNWKTNYQNLRRASRVISNLFTTYSINFSGKNLFRDTIYSMVSRHIKEDKAYRKAYRKNWWDNFGHGAFAYPMVRLAKQWEDGTLQQKQDPTTREQAFMDFMRDGGQTGYTIVQKVQDITRNIEREMKYAGKKRAFRNEQGQVTIPILSHFAELVSTLNEGFELLTRFTTYQTSREMGRTGQRSASDAKEVSVNFNRRGMQSGEGFWGNAAAWFGASHYFFNASVQGFENFLRLFKIDRPKMTGITTGFALLGMATPFINSMIEAAIGGDDGDDDWYWNIPDWVRRNNIIIGCHKFYLAIPLPVELRAFYGIGDLIAKAFPYNKMADRTAGHFMLELVNTLGEIMPINPVEGSQQIKDIGDWKSMADAAARILMPDITTFAIDFATNRNYTGTPLAKENPFSGTTPRSQGAFASTPKALEDACMWLAMHTGADFPPGYVRDFLNSFGGGLYRTAEDLAKILYRDEERPFRWDNIPFFSGFMGHIDQDRSNAHALEVLQEYGDMSDGIVREINRRTGLSFTTSDVYDDPEALLQSLKPSRQAVVKRIMDSPEYEIGRTYREHMNNKYKMVQYTRGPKIGQWHEDKKQIERVGIKKLKQDWKAARAEWYSLPKGSPEKAEAYADLQTAWQKYYDATMDLAEQLMDIEFDRK